MQDTRMLLPAWIGLIYGDKYRGIGDLNLERGINSLYCRSCMEHAGTIKATEELGVLYNVNNVYREQGRLRKE